MAEARARATCEARGGGGGRCEVSTLVREATSSGAAARRRHPFAPPRLSQLPLSSSNSPTPAGRRLDSSRPRQRAQVPARGFGSSSATSPHPSPILLAARLGQITHRAEVGAVAGDTRGNGLGVTAGGRARLQAARGQGLLDVTGVGVLVAKGDGEAGGLRRGGDVNRALVADTGVLERVEVGEVSLRARLPSKARSQLEELGGRLRRWRPSSTRRTGSVEKTGPSGARFTMKELALRRRSH